MDPTGSDARASNNAVEQHSALNSVWFWPICSPGGRGWSPVTGKLYGGPVFPEQKPRTTGDEEGGKKHGRRGNETLADATCALGGGGTVGQRGRRPSESPTPAVEGAAAGGQRCAAAAAKNRERLSREKKGGRGRGRGRKEDLRSHSSGRYPRKCASVRGQGPEGAGPQAPAELLEALQR